MTSDNGNARQEKINRILRLSEGETPEQIADDPTPAYELSPVEQEIVRDLHEHRPLPCYKFVKGVNSLLFDHPRQDVALGIVMKAVGATDETMFHGLMRQLVNAISRGQDPDMDEINTAITLVAGIKPRDGLEAMLAFQMATVHIVALRQTRDMVNASRIDQLELHERIVNKLMRTFTSQMEALRKHRNGGNQKVVVEHVHVHEGGQAIVGNVTHGGRGDQQRGTQFHGQEDISVSTGAAVLSHFKTDQMPMPSAGGKGQERMSFPWGESRSAEG